MRGLESLQSNSNSKIYDLTFSLDSVTLQRELFTILGSFVHLGESCLSTPILSVSFWINSGFCKIDSVYQRSDSLGDFCVQCKVLSFTTQP